MLTWAGGDAHFDLGGVGGVGGKDVWEDGAALGEWVLARKGPYQVVKTVGREGKIEGVLHSLGAAGPVAVVEVEAFALEDECADAILNACQRGFGAVETQLENSPGRLQLLV